MKEKTRKIVIDGVEIMTSLSAFEIADLPIKYEELKKENEKLQDKLRNTECRLLQKEDIINKSKVDLEKHLNAKSYDNHKYELFAREYLEEVLKILNNKGSDNNE